MSASAPAELAFEGPGRLAARVRAGEVSARELVELYLARIEALDPQLNALRLTRPEQALAEADALTDRQRPLAGVPFAVKDQSALSGEPLTRGSRAPAPDAEQDAPVVARLRAAGAIPIGISNVPELMIFPWTATAANGITRNPWDPSRTPGGSSGGSAAAVAAGLVPFATAGDGGGSIRIPSACCGLPGIKVSRGLSSDDEGWLGMAVSGTLSRTVADTGLLLDVTHGGGSGAEAGCFARAAATAPAAGLRIALSAKGPPGAVTRVSADQRDALQRTARRLESLGHHVSERSPALGAAGIEFLQLWWRGVYEDSLTISDRSLLERSTRQMAMLGRTVVPPWRRERLLRARERTSGRIAGLWEDHDLLLTPTLARTAIAAEGGYGRGAAQAMTIATRFTPFTSTWNMTGQPAMAIPAGVGSDGLPLSVQLIGRRGSEELLLGLAGALEQADPWADRRPAIA
jgi:amidase